MYFPRRSSEEILEDHIRDLKQQVSQRDSLVDRLRADILRLKEDHKNSLDEVGVRTGMVWSLLNYIWSSIKGLNWWI